MSDVFQEVDEEIRRQHVDKALRVYGPWVTAVVIVLLLGFGGYNFWQQYQDRRAAAAGDQFVHGMEALAGGDREGAEAAFAALAENGPGGYALLAQLQEAAAKRQTGDAEGAVGLYDQIAANGSNPAELRDLARYYAGLTALGVQGMSYEDIESRLRPVADGASPWRFHARETLAFAAFRDFRFDTARTSYQQLTDDALTPDGVAARAAEMLALAEAAIDAQAAVSNDALPETDAPAESAPQTE